MRVVRGPQVGFIAFHLGLPIGLRNSCSRMSFLSKFAMERTCGPPEIRIDALPTVSVWAGMGRAVGARRPQVDR